MRKYAESMRNYFTDDVSNKEVDRRFCLNGTRRCTRKQFVRGSHQCASFSVRKVHCEISRTSGS